MFGWGFPGYGCGCGCGGGGSFWIIIIVIIIFFILFCDNGNRRIGHNCGCNNTL